ncbi:dTDP-4-dehydrorhamnose reductase [Rhodothalassium salexigens]|uniref:dTDP-4-dehydrorhamnose reductase n=1 Tax=Rhodothalassium salexigens TaxID=1086 RepID=UPI0019147EAC|nr:dTDP-4-dehydrorhamnose reductase [Rhodothalassium salexigens]
MTGNQTETGGQTKIGTVLLTGAGGQLGRAVQRRAATGALALDPLDRAALDITDAGAVRACLAARRPAVVINAAGYTAVDRAEEAAEAGAVWAVNRDGAANLARACAAIGAPLIHLSTDYVFDGTKPGAYDEDDRADPINVYGASKWAGEAAVRALAPRHLILRTGWLFGPDGRNFVTTMWRLGATRDRLRVVDDQTGCPTYADDLARALLSLAQRAGAGRFAAADFGTFHIAGAGVTSRYDFARAIFASAAAAGGPNPAVEPIASADYPMPARRPANSALNTDRLAHQHGLSLRPWPDALADMLQHRPGVDRAGASSRTGGPDAPDGTARAAAGMRRAP